MTSVPLPTKPTALDEMSLVGAWRRFHVGIRFVRELVGDEGWPRVARYFPVAFWGLNGGLAAMFVLSPFPAGFMQLMDVAQNGYWHATAAPAR